MLFIVGVMWLFLLRVGSGVCACHKCLYFTVVLYVLCECFAFCLGLLATVSLGWRFRLTVGGVGRFVFVFCGNDY